MFRLAQTNQSDVFYDLGSGWGQNLIIALTEVGVSKAVGIEKVQDRQEVALERLDAWAKERPEIKGNYKVVRGDFERLLKGKLEGASLKEASVVFYGLTTYKELITRLEGIWEGSTGKRRLLYYYNCLFPEVLPSDKDYPFLMSEFPFVRPKNELEWLMSVVGKGRSAIGKGTPTKEELWDELTHDYDVMGVADQIPDYRRRLRAVLNDRQRK